MSKSAASFAKAFSWLSSHYENSKSTSGYLCELKQTLVNILRAFNRGKFLPESCLAFQNGRQTSNERKSAVYFQIWSFTYIAGYLSSRMTDIEGFLTIYGHSDNLLNNNIRYPARPRRIIVKYIYLLFNKLSLCPYMVRKPSISVILHDRYPAIYVNDHIWKCSADFLSLLVWRPF